MTPLDIDPETQSLSVDFSHEQIGRIAFDVRCKPHDAENVLLVGNVQKLPKFFKMMLPGKLEGKEIAKLMPREQVKAFGEQLIAAAETYDTEAANE